MTGTNCDLFTHNQSRSYLNHLVHCHTAAFSVGKYVRLKSCNKYRSQFINRFSGFVWLLLRSNTLTGEYISNSFFRLVTQANTTISFIRSVRQICSAFRNISTKIFVASVRFCN